MERSGGAAAIRLAGARETFRSRAEPYCRKIGRRRSFKGIGYDLPRLARLAGTSAFDTPVLLGIHHDMQIEASRDRWPPLRGTAPIVGADLRDHYRHDCGYSPLEPPGWLKDEYERSNWLDCYMAAELWRKIDLRRDPTMGFVSGKTP